MISQIVLAYEIRHIFRTFQIFSKLKKTKKICYSDACIWVLLVYSQGLRILPPTLTAQTYLAFKI